MKTVGKALTAVTLLSLICGFFGCGNGKSPEVTNDRIRAVSASCGHMNMTYSYSFYLRKSDGGWLLDADFATDPEKPRTEYECRPVSEEDAKELLDTVRREGVLEKLRRWKKPKIKIRISDETAYFTSILLADGQKREGATHIGSETEACFYRLAEKYGESADGTQAQ